MNKIISFCVYLSAIVYFVFSIVSYANFGQLVQGNIFKNCTGNTFNDISFVDPSNDLAMVLARLFFTLLAIFSYPLQTLPCRISMEHLLPLSPSFHAENAALIHRTLTAVILVGTFLVAWNFDNLALVSGIIGTFASIPICYILPFAFYYKTTEFEGWTQKRKYAAGLALFGIFAMIFSGASIVVTILYA